MVDLNPGCNEKIDEVSVPEIRLPREKLLHFLKLIHANDDDLLDVCKFTVREIECIRHFLMGKTAREIANELHLSVRTIEHRLEKLKDKLDCNSKSELFCRLQKLHGLHPDLFPNI